MSRTRLCVWTALAIATLSASAMVARRAALGPGWVVPHGPDTWKITMRVQGRGTGDARLVTLGPLDAPRQHVVREDYAGESFVSHPQPANASRRAVTWTQNAGQAAGPVSLHVDSYVTIASIARAADTTKPKAGDHLRGEAGVEADAPEIAKLARQLTAGIDAPSDVAEALYKFVERDVAGEPSIAGASASAVECLKGGAGDSAAKSRLLVALLRHCGIAARLVTGLTLTKDDEQLPHVWVEAWLRDHWLAMCPFYHHFGRVPRSYVVYGYDDARLVRGRNVRNLSCAFHVARLPADAVPAENATAWQRLFARLSLYHLPPNEQHVVEFLLLLPVAALVICVFRNVVGLPSFGTFAPALVGMVFRDLQSLPGVAAFIGLILVGWLMRRALDRFHLLQVPRTAVMLSVVVALLVVLIALTSRWHTGTVHAMSLFPVIILTGLIERFWTLDEEDGAGHSFRVLASTMVIAATVAVVVSIPGVGSTLFRCPEALGLVVAAQLLLGRYTGFRLSELLRFRDLVAEPPPDLMAGRLTIRRF